MKNIILGSILLLVPTVSDAFTWRVDIIGEVSQVDSIFSSLVSTGEPMSGYFI